MELSLREENSLVFSVLTCSSSTGIEFFCENDFVPDDSILSLSDDFFSGPIVGVRTSWEAFLSISGKV
ncbi:hypothetical protein NRI_0625 [Neorickettsia risticii str. Illinois]|uniref:Uncharacterized protein n=1 Tax=Neorickettsia risticii (strain Illinois) TaxID=434131 RepID=C6V5D4_NEORI|nr:hypothetical protein NRI_0625 [Neorickettsia risticii str. Illinois]